MAEPPVKGSTVAAIVIVLAPKSMIPAVKFNAVAEAVFIVNAEPIVQPPVAVRFMTKLPKFKLEVNFTVPIFPVPFKVKLEIVLPLKLPAPEITPGNPVAPMVKVCPLISITSAAFPKVITLTPVAVEEIIILLNNCTVVPVPAVTTKGMVNAATEDTVCVPVLVKKIALSLPTKLPAPVKARLPPVFKSSPTVGLLLHRDKVPATVTFPGMVTAPAVETLPMLKVEPASTTKLPMIDFGPLFVAL